MKQFYNQFSHKSKQNSSIKGVVIVDNSFGGVALFAKLRALPIKLVYLNVCNALGNLEANTFVKSAIDRLGEQSQFCVVLPTRCANFTMLTSAVSPATLICAQPPIFQARQYSATQAAVLSSTNVSYDGCVTVDGSKLASMIACCATEREIRAEMERCLQWAEGCDAVAFDDCVFSTQKHNFWSVAPNVKFFDCTDSVASMFFKSKKLRQSGALPSEQVDFCDKSGKTEKIFDKILQKIYKPY